MTTNHIFVGCDAHAKTLVNMIAINREPAEQRTVANTRSGRQKLIGILKGKAAQLGARIAVVYEASGQGFILHDELKAAGIDCYVLAPTKIERSSKLKQNKRDKPDAERQLDIIRAHVLAGTALPAGWGAQAANPPERGTGGKRHERGGKLG